MESSLMHRNVVGALLACPETHWSKLKVRGGGAARKARAVAGCHELGARGSQWASSGCSFSARAPTSRQ
eukprot:570534-Pyramimonas_sp.AAC.1